MAELRARYPNGCPTGSAVVTIAGQLPARWVIHAVGPRWRGGRSSEREQLESAYRTAMRLADEVHAESVTFPAISCGIYGYPLDEGADVGLKTVAEALRAPTSVTRATFVLFSDETFHAFVAALSRLEP